LGRTPSATTTAAELTAAPLLNASALARRERVRNSGVGQHCYTVEMCSKPERHVQCPGGFTDRELDMMCKDNPAKAIGLPPSTSF
jgi:hypothetical protein